MFLHIYRGVGQDRTNYFLKKKYKICLFSGILPLTWWWGKRWSSPTWNLCGGGSCKFSVRYLCFTCNLLNLEYPKGSGILCSLHYPPAPGGHAGQAWHQVHQLKDELDKSDMGKTFSSACNAYCRGLGLVRPRREYLCDAVPIAVV